MPEGHGHVGNAPGGAVPGGRGRLIGRRYRLLSPVGRGGMGMVWHAHDVLLDRDVAVKELMLPFGLDQASAQAAHRRVLREARSAARLSHPGIITVHDVVEEDGRPWIVMELIRAWSLEQAVRQSGPLPVVQAAEIGVRVLDALRHAHAAGILHRDVKPGNVLLTADRVVLTDFGIAAVEGDVSITQTGLLMGSPAYIPPERLQGRPVTPAADLWSFGATLYTAVEGRPPYEGPDAVAVLGAVLTQEPRPPRRAGALLPVIEGLLRKNPADRLPAGQVADLLKRILRSHGAPDPDARVPMPTSQDPTPAHLLPPLDIPSGPLPSRIIETPSGPVRVPLSPEDIPPSASPFPQQTGPVTTPPSDGTPTGVPRDAERQTAGPAEDRPDERPRRPGARAGRRRKEEPAAPLEERGARSVILIAVAALALIGVVVTALLLLLPGDSGEETPVAPARPPVAVSAEPTTTAERPRDTAQVPDGFQTLTEGGISMAVPKGWTAATRDGVVVFSGPRDSGQSIRVRRITDGSLAALQAAEQHLNIKNYPDYTQIRLGETSYRWPAAEWEYTYTNTRQVTVHAVTRYVRVGDRAYSITFVAPDFDWTESAATVRQTLWNTFTPG